MPNQTVSPSGDPTVPDLIRRSADGDERAFRTLVRRFEAGVYNLALHRLGDPVMAQEVAQDAFVRLFHSLGRFRFEASLKTWLFRVTTNLCHDQLRRARRRERLVSLDAASREGMFPEAASADRPDERVLALERGEEVRRAVAALSPELRDVVQLRYLGGLSYAEIAGTLGWPMGTVATRLHRALKLLGEHIRYPSVVEEGF